MFLKEMIKNYKCALCRKKGHGETQCLESRAFGDTYNAEKYSSSKEVNCNYSSSYESTNFDQILKDGEDHQCKFFDSEDCHCSILEENFSSNPNEDDDNVYATYLARERI